MAMSVKVVIIIEIDKTTTMIIYKVTWVCSFVLPWPMGMSVKVVTIEIDMTKNMIIQK